MNKPTPTPRREFMTKLVDPYLPNEGGPSPSVKPITEGSVDRATQTSLRDDTTKVISVGIKEIDEAIQYYFDNVIKPSVIQNGNRISVPVFASSPERFKSVQADGFYRDKNSKIMVPLITYKRESVTENRDLGNKLDGNSVNNLQYFDQRYNKRNIYDNFGALQNYEPQVARSVGVIPDYVTIVYSCILFTNFVEQNNKLVEAIQFASNAYWGDLKQFAFRTRVESFNNTTFLEQGEDRAAKTSFNLTLNGYLVPEVLNKDLATLQNKAYSISKVVFTTETVTNP
jgi:hypothetical protein